MISKKFEYSVMKSESLSKINNILKEVDSRNRLNLERISTNSKER